MKNRVFIFFSEYWFCILLSIFIILGFFLSAYYADLYEIGGDIIRFDLSSMYLIYVMPLYSSIYGGLSYLWTKKVWIPQLILHTITCMCFFGIHLICYKEIAAWKNIFIFSMCSVVFSLIGTMIVLFVCKIIKSIKEDKN